MKAPPANPQSSANASAQNSAVEAPKRKKVTQIKDFRATEANADYIILEWSEPDDVKDYKLYWDRGNNETRVLQVLTSSTNANNEFTLDHQTSAGIMGSDYLEQHGGNFRFQLSYISSVNGAESPRTPVLKVPVAAMKSQKSEEFKPMKEQAGKK